ncbi:MAG: helix-turn-helix transcriptional regulator [Verrucomicrobiota bacterium]
MAEANETQSSLAMRMDTRQSTVQGWLNGSIPRRRTLADLAHFLNVSVYYLLNGTETLDSISGDQDFAYRDRPSDEQVSGRSRGRALAAGRPGGSEEKEAAPNTVAESERVDDRESDVLPTAPLKLQSVEALKKIVDRLSVQEILELLDENLEDFDHGLNRFLLLEAKRRLEADSETEPVRSLV